jgi:hypothetical protein
MLHNKLSVWDAHHNSLVARSPLEALPAQHGAMHLNGLMCIRLNGLLGCRVYVATLCYTFLTRCYTVQLLQNGERSAIMLHDPIQSALTIHLHEAIA